MPKKSLDDCGKIGNNAEGWYATLSYEGVRKEKKRLKTQEEAEIALERLKDDFRKIEMAKRSKEKDTTLRAVTESFLEFKETSRRTPVKRSTLTRLFETFTLYVLPYKITPKKALGDMEIYQITTEQIQKTVDDLNKALYSWSTIKKTQEAWYKVYNYAIETLNIIAPEDNPMLRYNKYSEAGVIKKKPPLEIYTKEEAEKLEKELTRISTDRLNKGNLSHRYGYLVMLAACTGLRAAELCGLRKADIDWVNKNLIVRNNITVARARKSDRENPSIHITDAGWVKAEGDVKTKRSERTVPLNPKSEYYLKKLLEQFPEGELLAYDVNNNPVSPGILSSTIDDAIKRTGVRKFEGKSMHALRDYFAQSSYNIGVDLSHVSGYLGHSQISTTTSYYVTLGPDQRSADRAIMKESEVFSAPDNEKERGE